MFRVIFKILSASPGPEFICFRPWCFFFRPSSAPAFFRPWCFFSSLRELPPFSFFLSLGAFFSVPPRCFFFNPSAVFFSVPRRTHPGTEKKHLRTEKKHRPRPSAVRLYPSLRGVFSAPGRTHPGTEKNNSWGREKKHRPPAQNSVPDPGVPACDAWRAVAGRPARPLSRIWRGRSVPGHLSHRIWPGAAGESEIGLAPQSSEASRRATPLEDWASDPRRRQKRSRQWLPKRRLWTTWTVWEATCKGLRSA